MNGKADLWNDQVAMHYLSNGTIEVDQEGRIWRLRSNKAGKHEWKNIKRIRAENKSLKKYYRVHLNINGSKYNVLAHRIVWIAHNGIIPEGIDINHKDGKGRNNSPGNIELATRAENVKHSFDVLGRLASKGERHYRAKLTDKEVRKIRELYGAGDIFQSTLGKIYSVDQTQISMIVRRKTWKHVV